MAWPKILLRRENFELGKRRNSSVFFSFLNASRDRDACRNGGAYDFTRIKLSHGKTSRIFVGDDKQKEQEEEERLDCYSGSSRGSVSFGVFCL